jgi:hypothetical protein
MKSIVNFQFDSDNYETTGLWYLELYMGMDHKPILTRSTVTTAWRVLGLRIEETASRYRW